jgi:hypothetical protein
MAFRIKSLFGENENLNHLASKDRARTLTKRVDRQKDADLNSHQQRAALYVKQAFHLHP